MEASKGAGQTSLTMCQYDESGLLKQHVVNMQTTPYFAISHIWMEADWREDITGIDWPILVSPQKARFLSGKLFELVGTDYFWMDVLCVDQRSDEARTGVVNSIPAIYRGAEKTIIIREDGGIQPCCAKAIGYFESWGKGGSDRFMDHLRETHVGGIVESWTERLWPLQEMILSDNLLFTMCESTKAKQPLDTQTEYFASHSAFRRISDSLYCAASAWLEYGVEDKVAEWEYNMFLKAYINNGFVARRACQESRHRVRGLTNDFAIHLNSLRITSKPRDFILAILPQYGWYRAPPNVKRLTFGELWIDCVQQAEKHGFKFFPTVTKGLTGVTIRDSDDSRSPSPEIPLPQNLGDFIKLFGSHEESLEPRGWGKFIADVNISRAENGKMTETIRLVKESMMFSQSEWKLAHRGDLSLHGMDPVQQSETMMRMEAVEHRKDFIHQMSACERQMFLAAKSQVEKQYHRQTRDPRFQEIEGMKILNLMWTGLFEDDVPASHDWLNFEKSLIEDDPDGYQDTILRLTALISCGYGTSAFAWSKAANLIPAKTRLADFEILILVSGSLFLERESKNDAGNQESNQLFCAQQGAGRVSGRDLVLVSRATQQVIGKFPDFSQRTSDVETNINRMRQIYPEQNWIVTKLDK